MFSHSVLTLLLLIPAVLAGKTRRLKNSKGKGGDSPSQPNDPEVGPPLRQELIILGLEVTTSHVVIASGVEVPVNGPLPPGLGLGNPGTPILVGTKVINTGRCSELSDFECTYSQECTITKGSYSEATDPAQRLIIEEQRCLLHICDLAGGFDQSCIDMQMAGAFLSGVISVPIVPLVANPALPTDFGADLSAAEQGTSFYSVVSGFNNYSLAQGSAFVVQEGNSIAVRIGLFWGPNPDNTNSFEADRSFADRLRP